ncbi:MAG: decarboxylating NADP(+)-dependent phosphogluconate dehydrogenase [Candidatus Eremiobacteraeota bacterium]|nr:decarboxylating NADP(+)-dependent phosphogluconate dehydrogenase [Candidatus Eremiobacteraeota bacterium]
MNNMNFGLIGLAVMGQNLVLNIEDHGFTVAVYNRTASKTEEFIKDKARGRNIKAAFSIEEFVDILSKPRKIMIMVKAGHPVDTTIEELLPYLEQGDIIIDGGNSHFADTKRRSAELEKRGILFLGTGVSGGEEGARYGPCIMPGGDRAAYDKVEDVLLSIAAKVDDIPCCTYIGPGESGHYVKMVHNGIEYGDMQLIAEAYDFMRSGLDLSLDEIRGYFAKWKDGELGSFLMDITTDILGAVDPETGKAMLDIVLDKAKQKGTGKWTCQAALDLGIPISVIDSAVFGRNISALKEERMNASKALTGPEHKFEGNIDEMIQAVHDALLCSKISSYAQGMALLLQASREFGYKLNFNEIARIWKGGCIIRAKILEPIKQAFLKNPELPNLYLDDYFKKILIKKQENWRKRVVETIKMGIPCPATAAALEYYDSYRSPRLPANVIQAQRDYFGAHTYERVDKEGAFHSKWDKIIFSDVSSGR